MPYQATLVSVIIPTFGRSDTLFEALNSAANQTHRALEIIVVDDNRDPGFSARVAEICSEIAFPISIKKNTRTKGGCGARNTGIISARGDFVAFLDDDDLWHPQKIAQQLEIMEAHSESAVYCHFIRHDKILGSRSSTASPLILCHEDLLKGECPASTSLMMVRRDVLLEVGLFDESLPSFQDYDLWLRITKTHRILCLPKILASYRQHDDLQVSINVKRRSDGLNAILEKWGTEIGDESTRQDFEARFLGAAYIATGKRLIHRRYFLSIGWILKGIGTSGMRHNALYWLVIALLGKNLGPAVSRITCEMASIYTSK